MSNSNAYFFNTVRNIVNKVFNVTIFNDLHSIKKDELEHLLL